MRHRHTTGEAVQLEESPQGRPSMAKNKYNYKRRELNSFVPTTLHMISFILIKMVTMDKYYLCFLGEKIETERLIKSHKEQVVQENK